MKSNKCFIIAEIGVNHNGDLKLAKDIIYQAKKCGVDAVKFQTFKAEEFITDTNLTYTYKSQGKEVTESQIDMFKRYEFSKKQWKQIFDFCDEVDVLCFTTPQNKSDLDFIMSITDLKLIKVGSDDLTNSPLLKYYASKDIPMIISTGMSYENEIEKAISIIRDGGCEDLTVLHCVSSYPTSIEDVNMRKMLNIKNKFGVKVGFSDHTIDYFSAIVAVSMGASVVEKHFTMDKNLPGPDHWFSTDVNGMKLLVDNIRKVESILGDSKLVPTEDEINTRKICRRSIVAKDNLTSGTILTSENLDFKRPGEGLSPSEIEKLIGKRIISDIKSNQIIKMEDIEN
jgi:N-acetylneuraminate synthase/N,N'-diacetyllegionaminate synthase|tara:strand:+ start:361 stop:1383 length:1023 start_codon:yes stop_codon:yes gene_type:complete